MSQFGQKRVFQTETLEERLGTFVIDDERLCWLQMWRSAFFLAAVLVGSVLAAAQIQSGIVTGTVTDQTGAVLPSVKVVLENRISVHVSATTSNDRGEFVFNNVPFFHAVLQGEGTTATT